MAAVSPLTPKFDRQPQSKDVQRELREASEALANERAENRLLRELLIGRGRS